MINWLKKKKLSKKITKMEKLRNQGDVYTFESLEGSSDTKNIELDPKGVPKWVQNRCQHSSKFNAKTGIEKDHEKYRQSVYLCMVKSFKFIVKTIVLKV